MGWDYDARRGDATYHLTFGWGGRLWRALDAFGALDWDIVAPDAPASVWLDRDDDDPWPNEGTATVEELAYLGFESPLPGKVPGLKLVDNSLWLITARESELLADLIVLRADPALL